MSKKVHIRKNIYFAGIGGIGMSALARYFIRSGNNVAGYDRTPTELTRQLEYEGIYIQYEDDVKLIPEDFRSPLNTWVVYTPAIPSDHKVVAWFRKHGFIIYKRSEVLGQIARNFRTVAVAGTHGKTTVSTMIAHILSKSTSGCNALLGGISKNFNSNLAVNPKSDMLVTEADEFDRSFLQLYPHTAVITAMDPDHLDIYGNVESLHEAFYQFISQVDLNGVVLVKSGLHIPQNVRLLRIYTYSLHGNSDFYAENIRLENGMYHFNLVGPHVWIEDLSLEHSGLVNVENAVAATAMVLLLAIMRPGEIKKALQTFSGIQRRFDYKINTDKLVYIDDYAHHPDEIAATLRSVNELYPDRKVTGIFQPHLYSRTRDLSDGFAESLGMLDRLILLDIYPARELPIEGVTSEIIFRNVNITDKIIATKEQLPGIIEKMDIDVLITLGAGDIDKLVEPIRQLLIKKAGL